MDATQSHDNVVTLMKITSLHFIYFILFLRMEALHLHSAFCWCNPEGKERPSALRDLTPENGNPPSFLIGQ